MKGTVHVLNNPRVKSILGGVCHEITCVTLNLNENIIFSNCSVSLLRLMSRIIGSCGVMVLWVKLRGGSVHCCSSVLVLADQGENLVQVSVGRVKNPLRCLSFLPVVFQTGHWFHVQ